MFDALKERMMLNESRNITENALSLILESMEADEDLEESVMMLEADFYQDDDIEAYLNEIPDDEEDDDTSDMDYYSNEMNMLEAFIDAEHNHYYSSDIDITNESNEAESEDDGDLDNEDFGFSDLLI